MHLQYNNLTTACMTYNILHLVEMNHFELFSLNFPDAPPYWCQQLMLAWVRGERGGGDSAAGSVSVSWCPGHIMGPIITLLPLLLRCSEISVMHHMIQTNVLFQLTSRREDTGQEIQPGCDYRTGLCCSS